MKTLLFAVAVFVCQPNAQGKSECGYIEIEPLRLHCIEQIFIDHMGHEHKHIYCFPPREYLPEGVA